MLVSETAFRQQMQNLLSEGVAAASQREKTQFDQITGSYSRSLVLFGAGGIGRKTLAGLRRVGIEPLLFTDNNPALWNKPIDGVNVVSPQEACKRYGQTAAFVITIWCGEGHDRMKDRVELLRHLGCERITTFGPLFWKYPEVFLPHYAAAPAHEVHEQAHAAIEAAALWGDDASRREYESQIRWRLFFDFDGLADPVAHPIYFPSDLCSLIEGEVFVDCGAYDGDTIDLFLSQEQPGFRKIIALEPDPASFAKLRRRVSDLPARDSIRLHEAAVGASNCSLLFSGDGLPSSSVGTGSLKVSCVKLDDICFDDAPTYMKFDIEGAELDALSGARRIIEQYTPVLAVCSYHKQNHLWEIPRLIHSYNPDYRFFLRPHLVEVWDLVCYAIPSKRITG
jgi:FkbM family methyltransferase